MKLERIPLVGGVIESGADDRVYDGLLLSGPLVILVVVLLGRSVFTEALAAGYLLVVVGYVLYTAAT